MPSWIASFSRSVGLQGKQRLPQTGLERTNTGADAKKHSTAIVRSGIVLCFSRVFLPLNGSEQSGSLLRPTMVFGCRAGRY